MVVLIIFSVVLQTDIIVIMLSIGGQGKQAEQSTNRREWSLSYKQHRAVLLRRQRANVKIQPGTGALT